MVMIYLPVYLLHCDTLIHDHRIGQDGIHPYQIIYNIRLQSLEI